MQREEFYSETYSGKSGLKSPSHIHKFKGPFLEEQNFFVYLSIILLGKRGNKFGLLHLSWKVQMQSSEIP